MSEALIRHDRLLRETIERNRGLVFKTIGDAFCAAFSTAREAASAALEAQYSLQQEPWPASCPIRVRMAIHSGTAQWRDGDYFGPSLNRIARLLGTAHGGQIITSRSASDLLSDYFQASLKDLGRHRLK